MKLIFLAVLMQTVFSIGDILARKKMREKGSYCRLVFRPWILALVMLHIVAVSLYFYTLYYYDLSRVAVLTSSMALCLSVLGGTLYLKEKIQPRQLVAVALILIVIILQGIG